MKKSLIAFLFLIVSFCSVKPEPAVDPVEIAKFARTIADADLVFVKNGELVPFEIAPDGTYTDSDGITYRISQILDNATISSVSVDFGEQTHELLGDVFGVTFQEIAFKRATSDEIIDFKNNINSKGLISEQNGKWKPFSVSPEGSYTTDGVTYQIGQVIDNNTILVVKSTGGLETHKLVATDYGSIDASGVISKEVAFLRDTSEVALLKTALGGFIYHNSGEWKSFVIDSNNSYTINRVTYEIGKIIDGTTPNPTAIVAKSTGGVEKHKLTGSAKYGPAGLAELAFKGSTVAEINTFLNKLDTFIFAEDGTWKSVPTKDASITEVGTYQDISKKTYSIGQVSTAPDTVLVANSSGTIETHGIRGTSLGKINSSDDSVSKEIAFKRPDTTALASSLDNFIFSTSTATSSSWTPLSITTTPTTLISTYTVGTTTYEIGKINGNTIEVASSAGGIETHKIIDGTSFGPVTTPGGSTIAELAFKRATADEMIKLNSILNNFVYFSSGIGWGTLITAPVAGKYFYSINSIEYEIGRVINGNTVEVVSPTDKGIQTHSFYDSGKKYGIAATDTELAFKKDTDKIKEFANFINSSGLKISGGTADFKITTLDGSYSADGVLYEIGRVINSTTVEVASITELKTNGLRGIEYGTIDPATDTIDPAKIIASASKLAIFSGRLAEYSYAKNGEWLPITVTASAFEAQGKAETHSTYVIKESSINLDDNTVEVNGINIKLKDTEITEITGTTRALAIKKSDSGLIAKYSDDINLKGLRWSSDKRFPMFFSDEKWSLAGPKDYKIGRVDVSADKSTTNIIVSAKWAGITYPDNVQTQGYRETTDGRFFGNINPIDNTINTNLTELNKHDLNIIALRNKLTGFVYEQSGDWLDFPALLEKPSKAGVYSYVVGGATYNIDSINTSTWTVKTDKGTHKIIGDQFGPLTGSAIPFGKEIAIKKAVTSEIRDFATEANKLSYASGGDWVSINVTDSGTYDDRHGTYKIGRIDRNKALVAKGGGGTEIHELRGSSLEVYNIAGEFQRTSAYKKSDKTLIDRYIADINSKGLKTTAGTAFTITADGAYSDGTFTYKIGRVTIKISDSTTNILVSSTSTSILYPQTFGFRETDKVFNFGEMGSSGGAEIMSKIIATLPKTDKLKDNLAGFVFASDEGKWLDFPIMITATGTYTVGGEIYSIVRYIDDLTFEVIPGAGGTIIHKLMGDQYGPIDAIGDTTITFGEEIAVKKDIGTIRAFTAKVNALELTGLTPATSPDFFTINEASSHWSYTHDGNTYYIGRRIDEDTALVSHIKDGKAVTEVHGIRESKYGKILYSTDPNGTLDPTKIIAE